MGIPRVLPAVVGSIALAATVAITAIHLVLGHSIRHDSALRTTSILSAILEVLVLLVLGWILMFCFVSSVQHRSKRWSGILFGVSVLVCTLASAASVATMIVLSNATADLADSVLGADPTSFLIGSSAALGLAFACQLIFIVIYFVLARGLGQGRAHSLHTEEEARKSSHTRVKSIPYSQTVANMERGRRSTSADQSPPQSSSGRSATETMSSIRSSLSHVVRPISSKTRLLSTREKRRPASLDSNAYRESSAPEDSFDSWDTSAVDPQNRLTVLGTSSPPLPSRFLETIPASPTTSRSPSPGFPLDLEPPRMRRRSRSYSPVGTRRHQSPFTQHESSSESHIHPLFRSDSPTPPPAVTPGTMVIAAPNAGQVISGRQTIRRMRSDSLPAVPSPLSRQGSFDDIFLKRIRDGQEDISSIREEGASPTSPVSPVPPPAERKMTPPIPDWILSAGTRTSLSGYNSRKIRIEGDNLGQSS